MQKIIFATNNEYKVKELRSVLPEQMQILSLKEAGILKDIPEPYETLEENAREKADVIHAMTGENCFSEDTGLIVDALAGAPGVKSARYAGEQATNKENIQLLLNNLENNENRTAYFQTIICLIQDGAHVYFEGKCKGSIIKEERGEKGFGYDAVFVPEGSEKTFAEMDLEEKNKYSHRKKASTKLIAFLNNQYGQD